MVPTAVPAYAGQDEKDVISLYSEQICQITR